MTNDLSDVMPDLPASDDALNPAAKSQLEKLIAEHAPDPDQQAAEPVADPQAPATDAPSRRAKRKPRSSTRSLIEWLLVIGAALGVALLIKTLLIQAFYIPSPSMVPTLEVGDRVLVNKVSYKLHDIHRGDIVVFERPPGEQNQQIKDLIKRVIGLPGDTIEAVEGKVYINGRELQEPYLPAGTTTVQLPKQVVPAHMYYVLGDNRSNSKDSRYFGGPIAEKLIVGRAFLRIWPLSRLGFL